MAANAIEAMTHKPRIFEVDGISGFDKSFEISNA
jgi:hypothetical protein